MSTKKTIAKSFTVSTIEDGVSVQAQYAPNANPTSGQIHTVWKNGDLYMRTKSTSDSSWSSWHKIVGESGDETNYTFNISKDKTSTNDTKAPSNCYYQTWQDGPVTTNQTYPYLWMKVVKRVWNESTQSYVDGIAKYARITGEEATEYFIEGALNTFKVSAGASSTVVGCTYNFYKKSAVNSDREAITCYYAVYKRTGSTFSLLTMNTGYSNHGQANNVVVNATVPYKDGNTTYDAVVIFIFASEYYNTSPESQSYLAKKEIPIMKDGDNAFIVDLDNEMKNVALTEGGNTLTAVDFYFKVQAFYGTTNVLSDNECTVSASCSDSNVTLTTTATKTTGIRVQVAQDVALANSTDITVTVTHTTYGARMVIFTLAGVRGGANAVLQELLPSLDTISFARQSDGSLTPASRNLDLSIKKTQGGQTVIQTISESGLTIRWSLSVMPAQLTSGSAWGQGTATGVTWSGNTMQIANSISAEHVCIAAFNSAETLVDRETIPIVKDGQKGDDALTLVLDTYAIAFPTDSYYYVGSELNYTVGTKMFLGNNAPQTITSLTATSSDSDVYTSGTSPANGVKITIDKNTFENTVKITVTATCAKGSRTATINLTPTPQGEQGIRGKVGRFFYFAGTFNPQDNDQTHTFVVNDAQAPYFEHTVDGQKRYHVFNYSTNGSYTMAQMWSISNQSWSTPWELMTNDFKYLITEAIFGRFAHFGSFIINDDWLISQNAISDSPSNSYTDFDPNSPSSPNADDDNFIPVLAINGLTGVIYINDAHVKGEIVSSSGNIGGFTINSKWLGNLGGTNDQYGWTYITKDGSGHFFNKGETNAFALSAYGKIELVGNGLPVIIANSSDSYIMINGRLQIVEGMLQNTEAGDVYVDTLGLLHVRGNSEGPYFVTDEFGRVTNPSPAYTQDGFRQINVVRGNCTLPDGCPVGTVYYVKGTGSTTVSVTSGSNDWIEGWDDNDNKGNSVGIQSNSVQFVKTDTHIWTMFVGI